MGATSFNVAAGDRDGEIEFNVHDDVSGSSAFKQVEGPALDGKTVTVPMRRLDTLIPGPVARPAVLKIDTQGAELLVISGATRLLTEMDVVIVETSFHSFREGAPEISDVIGAMAEHNFVPYEILEGHYRPVDGALAQVDVAFVPRSSRLREQRGVFSEDQMVSYLKR